MCAIKSGMWSVDGGEAAQLTKVLRLGCAQMLLHFAAAVQPDVFAAAFAEQLQGSGMLAVMRIGIGSAAPIIIHTLLEPYSQTV